HQFAIYYLQLERDFAGWFISASVLFTSFIALLQTLTSAKGLQFLMLELASIDSLISTCNATSKRHYSAIFYAMYCIGLTRGIFRMVLMIQLGLRSPSFAVQLLVPSIIVLVRVNLQIYLMELIAAQLEAITAELTSSLEDAERCNTNEADTVYRCSCTLQRAECLYGRLQKCLLMVNALFGWSTAAIVVLVFVGITFQFRVPMYPLPFYVTRQKR
uniref:Gustatory receptor n=1 Tax=Anopheles arabiensis TaxID=7173 RepID=A0A182ID18_ANOAR